MLGLDEARLAAPQRSGETWTLQMTRTRTRKVLESSISEQIYVAFFRRQGCHEAVREERAHPRARWETTLTIWVQDSRATWDTPRELTVQTKDISCGGFGFVHSQFLYPKTIIRIRLDMLLNRPMVTGVVTECIHLDGHLHRVGVRFVESTTPEE